MIVILSSIAISIFILYVVISLCVFQKIPTSLSNTYYMYKEKKEWLKYLFPVMMFSVAGSLMLTWLKATEGSYLQFLSFLTCAAIMFVGAAPNFKATKLESTVHSVSAIIAAICAMLWCLFVVGSYGVILNYLVIFLIIALCTKTLKSAYIFWLEMVAFMSMFLSLIIYLIVM